MSDGTSTALPGELGLLNVTSTTNATAKVALDASASPGSRSVLVTTGGHESLATFVVPPHNSGPVAQAGVQGYVAVGATVYLDGSGSTLRTTTSNTAEFRTDQASLLRRVSHSIGSSSVRRKAARLLSLTKIA